LINLIGNAYKFTPAGGGIIVHVELLDRSKSGVHLRFSVADTGIGVPEDKQEKIFQAFEQADSSTTRQFGGTGLGLAISARLVDLMGGEIGLESKENLGTAFYFTAKIACANQVVESEELVVESSKDTGLLPPALRVLLAEDNLVNQKLAKRILEKAGCKVLVANNGQEAVDSFKSDSFDVILMDMQMPIMGGDEATRQIRDCAGGSSIPIVALTAHAMAGDREKYLSIGMDGYVSKPINRKDLFRTLNRLLEQKRATPATDSA
ncbi:MAG: response regulator, partial [Bdellovibrionales bacterium]|nr:response regulator [Bdellovibrionales bacterium]